MNRPAARSLALLLPGLLLAVAAPAQVPGRETPRRVANPAAEGLPSPGETGLPLPVELRPVAPPRPFEAGVIRATDGDPWPDWPAAVQRTFGTDQVVFGQRLDPLDAWDRDGSLPRPFRILAVNWLVADDQPTGQLDLFLMEDEGGHKPDQGRLLGPGGWTVTGVGPGVNTLDLSAENLVVDPPRMIHVVFQGGGGSNPIVSADDGLPNPGGTGDMHLSYLGCSNECFPGCSPARFNLFLTSAPDGSARGNSLQVWLDVDFLEPAPEPLFERHPGIGGCNRCAWGDVDGDGDLDALNNGRQLWLNDGAGGFEDVTALALPAGLRSTNGGLFADFDRDGDLDWFAQTGQCTPCANSSPPNFDTIVENLGDLDGDGVPEFRDRRLEEFGDDPAAPLPGDDLPTEGAAVADFNGDGWLDVYLANHVDWDTGACWPDHLWIADGPPGFGFTRATSVSGVGAAVLCGRGATPGDYDGDGDTDLFVSNYRLERDLLWENGGVGALDLPRLTDVAAARGVRGLERLGAYGHGIGSSFGDVDEDGDLDLFVGNLAHSNWLCFSDTTKLFLSAGEAGGWSFEDRRPESGIGYNEVHSDASLADIDNDGDLDALITQVYDGWRTSLYRNLGDLDADGVPDFEDVLAESGIGQRSAWGSAWADFDEDGDLDVWMRGGLFVNRAADAGTTTWLQLELRGRRSNPQSIGARATVEAGGRTLLREVFGARGTSSQDAFRLHFGLDGAPVADRVLVRWPTGCELELLDVPAGQVLELEEPDCLLPRFRVDDALGAEGRPIRLACAGAPVRFVDDSGGAPVAWEWDLDGDGVTDATGPEVEWSFPAAGEELVTLTVDDGASRLSITRPVRVDEPPAAPASGSVVEIDGSPCEAGLRVSWEPADWGAGGPGVYNVYRGTDEADALSRPPVALGLVPTTWDDLGAPAGVPVVHVVEAEDARSPGGCTPGPHHGGNTARLLLEPPVVDRIQLPDFSAVSAADASGCSESGLLVEWEPAVFHGAGEGRYHVYRAEGRCPEPRYSGQPGGDEPLVTGLTETSWLDDTALPGVEYRYLVQAEDRQPGLCRPGPLNRGPSTSICVDAAAADLAGGGGSADPGEALRAWREAGGVRVDWSGTAASPLAGEAWGLLFADDSPEGFALLPPGRLPDATALDESAEGVGLRFYLATILDADDCPAPDPLRP